MTRSIDADAIPWFVEGIGDIPVVTREEIDEMPTVDAVPVRHGKWIPHREKSREYIGTVLINVEYDYWLCDACGYRVKNGQPMYNFCPNCGAKMDGAGRKEDETD